MVRRFGFTPILMNERESNAPIFMEIWDVKGSVYVYHLFTILVRTIHEKQIQLNPSLR